MARWVGVVVAVAVLSLAPRPARATHDGCCLCSGNACRQTTVYGCFDGNDRHGDCRFVAGGTCGDGGCNRPSPTRTATKTPAKTPAKTRTATHTRRPSRTKTPRRTPTPSVTAEATASATLAVTEAQGATPTATAADTATATVTETAIASQTATPPPTTTATAADTATDTPSATPTETPMCQMTPRPGCRQPSSPNSWVLLLRDTADRKDRFVWKWRGESGGLSEFGAPDAGTDYAFCLYAGEEAQRVMQARAPAGDMCGSRACWRRRGERRFRYHDNDRTPDGLGRIALRARPSTTRAHVVVAGKGEHLALPGLPLAMPLRAQLIKSDGPECWEAVFSAPALRNSVRQFRDKND